MGTALDIDDDVLQAGEEIARREGKTSGEVISALARAALPDSRELQTEVGFRPFPRRGGVVTNQLVDSLREDSAQ